MRTIKFEKMLTDLKKTIDRKEIDLLPPYVFTGEVKVIEEERQVGEAADFLSRHACLGFDTETRPAFRKGEIYKVSLLPPLWICTNMPDILELKINLFQN